MLSAQSTTNDYIRAEGDFYKEIYTYIVERTSKAEIRPEEEWEGELLAKFMEWNTVERAIKTETDTRTEQKSKLHQGWIIFVNLVEFIYWRLIYFHARLYWQLLYLVRCLTSSAGDSLWLLSHVISSVMNFTWITYKKRIWWCWWWWLFPHLRRFREKVQPFIPCPCFFFFKVEISLRTLIPLFRSGPAQSGSATWDDCDRVFPDELRVSSFPDRFPNYAWTVV